MRLCSIWRRAEQALHPLGIAGELGRHEVRKNEQVVELTPLEFQVLEMLMQSPGQVVRRADLCMQLMENGYTGSEATLKIHIRNLRLKLEADLNQPKYIETVFGVGYRFMEPAE